MATRVIRHRILSGFCLLLLSAPAAWAQDAPAPAWTWNSGGLALEGGIDTYSAHYTMRGTWWNLSAAADPDFDKSRSFAELWIQPKLNGSYRLDGGTKAYGAMSIGATKTLGSDPFEYENQGEVRSGSAMLGLRGTAGAWRYDLAAGKQPFTLGTGMLLTAGSSNGYSWGGGASAQRKVWGRSVVARAGRGEWTGTAFALEPDEAREAETDTGVQGLALEWSRSQVGKAGISWFTVPHSNAVYPGDLAPLYLIDDGRDGLDTWHGWADLTGLVPGLPTLGFRAEFAEQRNRVTRAGGQRDPLEAGAWLLGVSWRGQSLPFAPKFSYHVARFSGDDPDTDSYERFDPMYWGNGLDNWWFGANGAYSWLNANLRAHRFIVDVYPSPRDILQFQYVHASVDQLDSAVQFGQGARFTTSQVVLGVPESGLSHEYYFQYARVFSARVIALAFVSRSNPDDGLKAASLQGSQSWTTFGLGLTANF